MANSHNNPTSSAAVAELLPDPTQPQPEAAPGDADDLIASIADQQIDQLINQSDASKTSAPDAASVAAEVALNAADELQEIAQKLSAEARADLVADLNGAATEAMLTPIPEAKEPPAEAQAEPVATPEVVGSISIESNASADAVAPIPAVTETPTATPERPIAADVLPTADPVLAPVPASVDPLAVSGPAMVLAPADTEINQAEIDALIAGGPAAAPAVSTNAVHADESESSAEAVARELAADISMASATPRTSARETPASKFRDALSGLAMTALEWVNLPVRGLSDNAREIIGIVAIVTLVNAMSLLLYLMLFR